MKLSVERQPESEAVFSFEFEWDEVEKAGERAYRKLSQRYNIPGFRRGHAPRAMLERMLGKEAIYQEGIDDLLETSYAEAVRQHDLHPLGKASIDAAPLEIGQPYTIVARVPILTPPQLGEYQAIRVPKPSIEVGDNEVDEVIERMREELAIWEPAERPAQVGDRATVDLRLMVGEKQVSDLHDNEFTLVEERTGIFTGMDAHIVGMSVGDSKEFTTTIPEDYANSELAGKEASYTVTLKGLTYRELPELNDEFAETVGPFTSLENLRDIIRSQIAYQKDREARRAHSDQVLGAVIEQSQLVIHPVLIAEEVDTLVHEAQHSLEVNRLSLEQYLNARNLTEQEFREELTPDARRRVAGRLVLNAVAEAEHIEVSDRDLQQFLDIAQQVGEKVPRLRSLSEAQRHALKVRLQRERALNRLVQIATQDQAGEAPEPAAQNAQAAALAAEGVQGEEVAAEATAATDAQTEDAAATSDAAPDVATAEATEPLPESPAEVPDDSAQATR